MSVSIWWDVSGKDVADPEALRAFIIESLNLVTPQGTRGFTLWIGPTGSEHDDMPLRLDLDPEPGRAPAESIEAIADLPEITADTLGGAAAVRWVPDGRVAVERDFDGQDIQVMEHSNQELVSIPAALARVSLPSAIGLAVEYLETGQRPTSVEWRAVSTD